MKKILYLLMVTLMISSLVACGPNEVPGDNSQSEVNTPVEEPDVSKPPAEPSVKDEPEEAVKYSSYQDILDAYTVKLQEAAPMLVEEYKADIAGNTEGLEGLAKICNEKITKLAEISNEGISEMADYYYKHGSGSYEEYSEWAGKIMDVYMKEATQINNAYMESAK